MCPLAFADYLGQFRLNLFVFLRTSSFESMVVQCDLKHFRKTVSTRVRTSLERALVPPALHSHLSVTESVRMDVNTRSGQGEVRVRRPAPLQTSLFRILGRSLLGRSAEKGWRALCCCAKLLHG